MTRYKTYLSVIFNSRGAAPPEIVEILKGLGWEPIYGGYDFVYEWDSDLKTQEDTSKLYFEHINNIHNRLENLNVSYSLSTYKIGKEDASPQNTFKIRLVNQ